MCGIAGFMGRGTKSDLSAMVSAIVHRGPDDHGALLIDRVGLGHARLSIIDTSSAGHQPMTNKGKSVYVVFNGEIYNFQKLRMVCEKSGYMFSTRTDTEVILALYEIYGTSAFEKLEGMFAVALYDRRGEKLIFVRDRFGKKPLYIMEKGDTIIFGSELHAITRHPLFIKELNPESVRSYFFSEYIPTPLSIYKGVKKMKPATYVVYEKGTCTEHVFWSPSFEKQNISRTRVYDAVDALIGSSVKDRLVSDVPLGILLSGGLDSSTIAYYAQKENIARIKTFSIGFSEKTFDESHYARLVARRLGTEHHEKIISATDIVDNVRGILEHMDEPLADDSYIPTYIVSQFAKEHVTVVLGGDGGDEIFMGYPTFQAQKMAEYYRFIPKSVQRHIVTPFVDMLPISHAYLHINEKMRKFAHGFSNNPVHMHAQWLASFSPNEMNNLFNDDFLERIKQKDIFTPWDQWTEEDISADVYDRVLYSYLRGYLMDDVLVKVDRVSMAHALEVRAPLLDHRLVEYLYQIPHNWKMRGFTTKYLLKHIMRDRLPRDVVYRTKQGFALPVSSWLRDELRPLVEEVLSSHNIRACGIHNEKYIHQIVTEHIAGRKNNKQKLWSLLVFYIWYAKHFNV